MMKVIALISVILVSACSNDEAKGRPVINGIVVLDYAIRCVGGVAYLRGERSIVVMLTREGMPVQCTEKIMLDSEYRELDRLASRKRPSR